MTVETLQWVLGAIAVVAWWLFTDKITTLKTDFENGLNSLRTKSENQQVQIQYLLVEIEKRVTRDELNSLRHEIKNDFRDFKDDLIEALGASRDNSKPK